MSDADDRFVESLAAEMAPLVGPRLRVLAIDMDRPANDRVRIVVTLETSATPLVLTEESDSVTEAASRLLARAAEARLADAFREMIDGESV